MSLNRLGPNQVLTRQCRLTTLGHGFFDLVNSSEVANVVSQATLATGQQRPSGQLQASDVTCAIMWEDDDTVARLELWDAQAKVGAPGYLEQAATFQYERVDGTPVRTVAIEECYPHTLTYPATDLTGEGEGAMLTFILSVYNPRHIPGS